MARAFAASCMLALALGAGVARAATPAWLYPAAGPCGEALPDSLAPPPGATAMAVLLANVTRTYTCPDNSTYTISIGLFTPDGEEVGKLVADSSNMARPITFVDASGAEIGSMLADQASEYLLDVTAGNTAWSRRAIKEATGAAQGAAYVIRTDTEGNADASCARIKDGEAVVGNYQAVYSFYGCGASNATANMR